MTDAARPNIRVLSDEQREALASLPRRLAATDGREPLRRLALRVTELLDVKAAAAVKVDGRWVVLAEARSDPDLPPVGAGAWADFDRLAGQTGDVHIWHHEGTDWTLIALDDYQGVRVTLVVEADWTPSSQAWLRFAHRLRLGTAVPPPAPSGSGEAVQRLCGELAAASGLKEVCTVVLRHVVNAVPSRFATIAVPTDEGELKIVATRGFSPRRASRMRASSRGGVFGVVCATRSPLCVADVTTRPELRHRRRRYRTNAFLAVPVCVGTDVLAVICLTDRMDRGPFSQDDLDRSAGLASAIALALARERATGEAKRFAKAAVTDPGSGLFNRRYFNARLDEELQRARRQQTSVALGMVDIDDFKAINDRFGHLSGDAVIRSVAGVLRTAIRRFDVCARVGGEEFAVLMPGGNAASATTVAERIRRRIEQIGLEAAAPAVQVTASIGLAFGCEVSAEELFGRADQALYEAKESGKNRVAVWTTAGPGALRAAPHEHDDGAPAAAHMP